MCGFAGVINLNELSYNREERLLFLKSMGQQMARRGPDDEQTYDDGLLSLVFRRLSIIDVEGGRQPLWNENNTVMAVVNGEIYNHLELRAKLQDKHNFSTLSDSEVVVHLYEEHGADFVRHLNGMFAIVLWDTRQKRLLLVKDRLGIKPLYYTQVGDTLLFASELKAMLVHPLCPKEFDWSGFRLAKIGLSVPTYVKNVYSLLGGHMIECKEGKDISPVPYWMIQDYFSNEDTKGFASSQEYIDGYEKLLADSVRKRLMSDVPVGLFLSGGIDSAMMAAMSSSYLPDLHCFTVVERTTVKVGDVEQAQKIAEKFEFPFYPVLFDSETLLNELDFSLTHFEYLVWVMEKPSFSLEWLLKHELHRYAKTVIPELKVMLLGQGADEFSGGYSNSIDQKRAAWGDYYKVKQNYFLNSRRQGNNIPEYLFPLLSKSYPQGPFTESAGWYHEEMLHSVFQMQRYNLWHEDRTSSAQGIESRVPFLDHRLVEFLASIPPAFHAELFFNKQILREQFTKWLPEYPKEKHKVKFFNIGHGNDRSIYSISSNILKRVFPEFSLKYLERKDAIFSRSKLNNLYQQVVNNEHINRPKRPVLFQCMAITIFAEMCQNLINTGPPTGSDPPSPLHEAQGVHFFRR